ncbi:hypothetical protein TMEC54S_00320 [Thauera mechernichensis]
MDQPEIIVLKLSNGDTALYVNKDAVLTLEADEEGKDPAAVGHYMAKALDVPYQKLWMVTPEDPEWSWDDAYSLIPSRARPA